MVTYTFHGDQGYPQFLTIQCGMHTASRPLSLRLWVLYSNNYKPCTSQGHLYNIRKIVISFCFFSHAFFHRRLGSGLLYVILLSLFRCFTFSVSRCLTFVLQNLVFLWLLSLVLWLFVFSCLIHSSFISTKLLCHYLYNVPACMVKCQQAALPCPDSSETPSSAANSSGLQLEIVSSCIDIVQQFRAGNIGKPTASLLLQQAIPHKTMDEEVFISTYGLWVLS
ncbi:hypothetical protein BYT27DRAFT_6394066 [Phlegmacium glaucopus]|nr:hypothetical protein BYT27DRAFT_6394066 [Phlegmacium glaucopus]